MDNLFINAEKKPVNSKLNEINSNIIKKLFLLSCFSKFLLKISINNITIDFNNSEALLPTVAVDDKYELYLLKNDNLLSIGKINCMLLNIIILNNAINIDFHEYGLFLFSLYKKYIGNVTIAVV